MRKSLQAIGINDTIAIINRNHAVETAVSLTRKKELAMQLDNPKAGPLAHMKSCGRCASDIERAANEKLRVPLSAPVVATA